MRRYTVGCQLCVQWRYGSALWQALRDLKESHTVDTEEHAVAQEIDHKPTFNWWVKAITKKMLRITSLVNKRNARYLKETHKFGIEVPKSVAQAYALDKKNGNTQWVDAITKDMKDVRPAFKKLESEEIVPIGYHWVNYHMIFDVKMEDFRRKARLLTGGHVAEPPATIMYAIVFSRETAMIDLTLAALNDLPVKVAQI